MFEVDSPGQAELPTPGRIQMDSTARIDMPLPPTTLPQQIPPHLRIALPLHRVLDFARQESDTHPSRQLASALRPLLGVALATAGFCQGIPPELPTAATANATTTTSASRLRQLQGAPATAPAGDTEILFTALSSLVEVVKSLTPSAGRIYAHLGHEAHEGAAAEPAPYADPDDPADDAEHLAWGGSDAGEPDSEAEADAASEPIPRSEVVIELVSVASPAYESLSPAIHNALGALAFELATVAAIVESKGGQLHLAAPGGHSRRFVVRLPVWRS
jgi:hypothetical protein